MKTNEVIASFSQLAKCEDPAKFWEDIKVQNKQKKWSITPVRIEFKDGQIVENSEDIKKLVGLMTNWAENELKVANIDTLEKDTEITREIYAWFSGSRKQVTKTFDEIKKNFTAVESEIKKIGISFKDRKEKLLEEEYQKREIVIIDNLEKELKAVEDEYKIKINKNLFSDFISSKRKTKVLTEKGALTKKIKDEIKFKINEILEPILKEREAQKLKEQDLQKLTLDLQDINTNALFIEELENAKTKLEQILNTAEIGYPNAVQEAKAQLRANIQLAKANIARIKAEEEKEALRKAEEERKKEEEKKEEEIKQRAEQLQKMQQTEVKEEVKEEISKEEISKEVEKIKWKIPLEEIEVIASIKFEAESEEEAKEKIIEMFKQQLEFIELIKIGGKK